MGSGKTYWGKLWAQQSNLDFFDLDEMIEDQENKTIASIFDTYGEAYFREKESEALKAFQNINNCIVACGGGTVCFNDNINWMNKNGITVYLIATASTIFNRVLPEQGKRPLIKNLSNADLLIYIKQKLKERESFYNQAKIILPEDELNINSIKQIINYQF